MKSTQWDRVVSSSPLDTTAAVVRDGKGESFETRRKISNVHRDTPFILRGADPKEWARLCAQPRFVDHTGFTYGRLTVQGMVDCEKSGIPKGHKAGGARWAVRCVCGMYECRSAKSIGKMRKGLIRSDECMCHQCDITRRMRDGFGGVK